jgi:hypothetical protein
VVVLTAVSRRKPINPSKPTRPSNPHHPVCGLLVTAEVVVVAPVVVVDVAGLATGLAAGLAAVVACAYCANAVLGVIARAAAKIAPAATFPMDTFMYVTPPKAKA